MKKIKLCLVVFCLAVMMCGVYVYATDSTAKLKESLESDILYTAVDGSILNNLLNSNKELFKTTYDDKYVVVKGNVFSNSFTKNNKEILLYGNNGSISIDTSDNGMRNLVDRLKSGDSLTVYGKVNVKGITGSSMEIIAQHGVINSDKSFENYSKVFYADNVINGTNISDLAEDGHIMVKIPEEWKGKYVSGSFNNNGVKGYQFYLNALEPFGKEYPEIFYMFYFDYMTYLDTPPNKETNGDRHDIEELVAKNILESIDEKFKVNFKTLEMFNEDEVDYWSSSYNVDGKDYKLEFVMKADNSKGLVVMLYLYYPRSGSINHVQEVAYVVESIETK